MAIQFSSATSNDTAGSPGTVSHTIGTGSNRLLVVVVSTTGFVVNDATVSSITYGGFNLTEAVTYYYPSTYDINCGIWYLLNPPSGTDNVTVTYVGSPTTLKISAMSYTGVGGAPVATTTAMNQFNVTSVESNISVVNGGSMIILGASGLNAGAGPQSPYAGFTERTEMLANFRAGGAADYITTAAGTYLAGWSNPSTWPEIALAAAVFPAFASDNSVFFGMNF